MAVTVSTYDNANVWGPVVVMVALVLANLLAWALNERSWPYRHLLSKARVPKMLFISNRCALAAQQHINLHAVSLWLTSSQQLSGSDMCVVLLPQGSRGAKERTASELLGLRPARSQTPGEQ
jgi:hypothetical protein